MAGREDEAEQVVADVILVDHAVEIRHGCPLLGLDLATELVALALEEIASSEEIDGAMLGGGHEPGARIVRDARLWPTLERRDERVLGELFSETHVAHHPGQTSD